MITNTYTGYCVATYSAWAEPCQRSPWKVLGGGDQQKEKLLLWRKQPVEQTATSKTKTWVYGHRSGPGRGESGFILTSPHGSLTFSALPPPLDRGPEDEDRVQFFVASATGTVPGPYLGDQQVLKE